MVWKVPPEDTLTREALLKAREEDGKGCMWCNGVPPDGDAAKTFIKCGWCRTKASRTATNR